jgi:hypothetical protein
LPDASAARVGLGTIWISSKNFIWSIGSGSVRVIEGICANSSACAFISPLRTLIQWL